MKYLYLFIMLLVGCIDRALPPANHISSEPAPVIETCCEKYAGRANQTDLWICKGPQCPELDTGIECSTLSNTQPTYCQIPPTDDCKIVYLENLQGDAFQTIYCF